MKAQQNNTIPIIFTFGPSGVGKSTFGAIAAGLDLIHIEQDQFDINGIDEEHLRAEWDEFMYKKNARSLAQILRSRTGIENKNGVVMTFDSTVVLPIEYIEAAHDTGIQTIVLFGPKDECYKSFLKREKELKRGLQEDEIAVKHWRHYNLASYDKYSSDEYAPYRKDVFQDGERISHTKVVDIIKTLL